MKKAPVDYIIMNSKQKIIYDNLKQYYKREIIKNNKKYPNSFLNKNQIEIDMKEFYNFYIKNIKNLLECYSHNYLNYYNLSNYEDFNNSINFKNFSFTKKDLIKNFNKDKGFYQPFLAYKNLLNNNKIKIIGGRHRYQALLNINFFTTNHLVLYLDEMKDFNEIELYIPKVLFDNLFLNSLIKNKINLSDNYYKIYCNNSTDVYIIMKIFERELDFFIEYYSDLSFSPDHTIINL